MLETDGIHAIGFKLTSNADFITLYRSYLPIIPLAIQEHRILKLGSLTALLQLTRQYSTPNVILQTDATEGHWQLNQSDDETSLELLENQVENNQIVDKYGVSLQRLHNLPVDKPRLAAFGAAIALYQPDTTTNSGIQPLAYKSPDPFFIRYLAFRGMLFVCILTCLLYGLIALSGHYYSKQQFTQEQQSMSIAGQRIEFAGLKKRIINLKKQKRVLDSLSAPSSFMAIQLLQLAEATPEDLWLSCISSDTKNRRWNIAGYAREDNKVAQFLSNLQSLDSNAKIELKELLTKSEFRHIIMRRNLYGGYVYFEVLIASR